MLTQDQLTIKHSSFSGIIGVAKEDITPPVGIYARNWGASKYDIAEGIHSPLILVCQTFQSSKQEKPLVLISADLGWFKDADDELFLRSGILSAFSFAPEQLMICFSHTHAGPGLCRADAEKPGGNHIEPYLLKVRECAIHAIENALSNASLATISWQYGKCSLATNRDLPEPGKERFVVGFNPDKSADDTLLVGRITNEHNEIIGTIVNYACHPTTLAWDNQLISPDYIGTMRDLIELETHGPCLFLQGASGELAPAQQYVGDVSLAEKYGRQLGYAVLSALESMLPHNTQLSFDEVVESGAPLAVWKQTPFFPPGTISAEITAVKMPLKSLPSLAEIDQQLLATNDRVLQERLWRKHNVRKAVGESETASIPLWVWRLGDALLMGQPNEAYADFQQELRKEFSPAVVAVMNVVNGHIGYLPPADLYDENIYQVWQSPFESGSLELLIKTAISTAKKLKE
jgi:hypothetical protein